MQAAMLGRDQRLSRRHFYKALIVRTILVDLNLSGARDVEAYVPYLRLHKEV